MCSPIWKKKVSFFAVSFLRLDLCLWFERKVVFLLFSYFSVTRLFGYYTTFQVVVMLCLYVLLNKYALY